MSMGESEVLARGLKVSTVFDEYTVGRLVGQGGSGRVFAAKDGEGKDCAIKFIESEASCKKLKRFKNEIRFCELCEHPNIVKILDHGCAEISGVRYSFYVMPLFEKSLRVKMKEGITPDEAIAVFVGILHGLRVAHNHGAIHRDIKPENIMFNADNSNPVICDFGIAHLPSELQATAVLTQPGDRLANFAYSAPEQRMRGGMCVPQTDVYSAALILNEMFTHEIPEAHGFKRIGDVQPSYSFLDEVFDQIFKQSPEERMYPEDKIVSEIKIRAEMHKNTEAAKQLQSMRPERTLGDVEVPRLVDKQFKSGRLIFRFDNQIPAGWIETLKGGQFNHAWLMGYDVHCVSQEDNRTLAIPIRAHESGDNVIKIMSHFLNWVQEVTGIYSAAVAARRREEIRRREEERKNKILMLEEENEINRILLEFK